MSESRRFDFRELAGADDPGGDTELGEALAAARALEAALTGPDVRPSAGLADHIMSAVAREAAPRPVGIVASLQRRPSLGGVADSLRLAWARAFTSGRPLALRAGALAYIAAVVVLASSLTGVAAYTTAGALGLLGGDASQQPAFTPGLATPAPLVSPRETELGTPEPSETAEPRETAEPSEDSSGGSGEPGDDSGSGSGESSSSGSSGGDGGADGTTSGSSDGSLETQTPRPSQTMKPTQSPDATGTPKPTSSD